MAYGIELTSRARRSLSQALLEPVAAACWEFIVGPLAEIPQRVGKPLRGELAGRYSARRGTYRIIYEIHEDRVVVLVVTVEHRRDAYR